MLLAKPTSRWSHASGARHVTLTGTRHDPPGMTPAGRDCDRSGRDPSVALHTGDSTFHMHGLSDPASGLGPVRDLIASLLKLVPDLHFEAKRGYFGAAHIVLEYDVSGHSGESHFVCDGVDVIAVSD